MISVLLTPQNGQTQSNNSSAAFIDSLSLLPFCLLYLLTKTENWHYQNLLGFQLVQYLVTHSTLKFVNKEFSGYWIIGGRVAWFCQCYWHPLAIAQLIYCIVIDLHVN